jgi:DNA-binding transcriptional MerR regulator|tara:strand:- start:2797 stop:3666 length:870 start_codon:yes stop_codon:yes gene_type:complete
MTNHNQDTDNLFPIRDLSARTQVNTVTLRAWERRYGLLTPQRTLKGHRLYSDHDVATIEKILALVARGVPLGKVKPLLETDISAVSEGNGTENWQSSIAELIAVIELFSVSKVENLIQRFFANYPAPICRERLMEPVFAELVQRDDNGAALGFAESELVRYALTRLSAKVSKKKRSHAVTLIAGNQAPIWHLALMALELTDVKFSVYLLTGAFSVATGIELAGKFKDAYTVFYQDGCWKVKEQELLAAALLQNDRLLLCGTAPVLTRFDKEDRVFGDVNSCISGLLKLS